MTSLIPDVAGTQAALNALHVSTTSVNTTAQSLVDTDLNGAIWQLIGAANPTILTAVKSEQVNAKAFLQLSIMAGVKDSMTAFAATFAAQSAIMVDTLTAAGMNPLTPVQQKTLSAAMGAVMSGLDAQQSVIAGKSAATKTLSDQINNPTGDLITGEKAVQAVIASTTKNLNDLEAIANLPGGGQNVAMGIIADQAKINWLQGLLSTLQGLSTANGLMGNALAGTLVIWQTLIAKYQSVQSEIDDVKTDPSFVGIGDVKAAQAGWTQLVAYAATLK